MIDSSEVWIILAFVHYQGARYTSSLLPDSRLVNPIRKIAREQATNSPVALLHHAPLFFRHKLHLPVGQKFLTIQADVPLLQPPASDIAGSIFHHHSSHSFHLVAILHSVYCASAQVLRLPRLVTLLRSVTQSNERSRISRISILHLFNA